MTTLADKTILVTGASQGLASRLPKPMRRPERLSFWWRVIKAFGKKYMMPLWLRAAQSRLPSALI